MRSSEPHQSFSSLIFVYRLGKVAMPEVCPPVPNDGPKSLRMFRLEPVSRGSFSCARSYNQVPSNFYFTDDHSVETGQGLP